jgi:hypothetical protein
MSKERIERKGLLLAIHHKLGDKVASSVEEISYNANIYILSAVDIHKVTDIGLRIEFASYQARYPDRTYDQFLKYKSSWDEDKYTFTIEPQGYFIDEETAVEYAESNMGDVNAGGAYPYIVIGEMPINQAYPYANTRKHRLFLFNTQSGLYEEIDWDYSEGTRYLKQKAECSCSL